MPISLKSLLLLNESSDGSFDGDKYFSNEGWEIANGSAGGKSRHIIVHMSPNEFLTVALRMPSSAYADFLKRSDEIRELMKKGVKMSSLPQLSFVHDGNGTAQAVAHDGRHRALSLKIMGVKSMPVLLTSRESGKGRAIRWNDQNDHKSYDYYKGTWPVVLKGETSGEIPFPVRDLRVK
mgnify:CR=1 FL=1